jgi:hypothetical protein
MSETNVKRVQTELASDEYKKFIKVLKQEGLTVKEAARQALEEWASERIKFDPKDPLFDFSKTIEIGKDSSKKIDKVVYSREAID